MKVSISYLQKSIKGCLEQSSSSQQRCQCAEEMEKISTEVMQAKEETKTQTPTIYAEGTRQCPITDQRAT